MDEAGGVTEVIVKLPEIIKNKQGPRLLMLAPSLLHVSSSIRNTEQGEN